VAKLSAVSYDYRKHWFSCLLDDNDNVVHVSLAIFLLIQNSGEFGGLSLFNPTVPWDFVIFVFPYIISSFIKRSCEHRNFSTFLAFVLHEY
jgi:hypothetical protein